MIQARNRDGEWADCKIIKYNMGTGIVVVELKPSGERLQRSLVDHEVTGTDSGLDEIFKAIDEIN